MDYLVSDDETQLFVLFVAELMTGEDGYVTFWDDNVSIDGIWTISPELKDALMRVRNAN